MALALAGAGRVVGVIVDGARRPSRADDQRATAEAAQDIVEQSDRLGAWVRELLAYTRPADGRSQTLAVTPLGK